eukprot:6191611-Pleurochrysis_carterae.AAC.3
MRISAQLHRVLCREEEEKQPRSGASDKVWAKDGRTRANAHKEKQDAQNEAEDHRPCEVGVVDHFLIELRALRP